MTVLASALSHADIAEPKIIYSEAKIKDRWHLAPSPVDKAYIPTDEEMARLLAAPMPARLMRWLLISMLTGCRPGAAVDLTPHQRVRDARILRLNPPGRAQNKKYRADVREPRALKYFLDRFDGFGLDEFGGRYSGYATVEGVKTALERLRIHPDVNVPALSAYSLRQKVTTVLRRAGDRVGEDQIACQLGHKRPHLRTTGGYGEFDPSYLKNAAHELDKWFFKVRRRAQNIAREHAFSRHSPDKISVRSNRAA